MIPDGTNIFLPKTRRVCELLDRLGVTRLVSDAPASTILDGRWHSLHLYYTSWESNCPRQWRVSGINAEANLSEAAAVALLESWCGDCDPISTAVEALWK